MELIFHQNSHKYTDENQNDYISVTQFIDLFVKKFDSVFWSRAKGIERLIIEAKGKSVWYNYLNSYKKQYKQHAWNKLVEDFCKKNDYSLIEKYTEIIKAEWKEKNKESIVKGNERHDYLELNINKSLKFKIDKSEDSFKVFTIKDLYKNHYLYNNDVNIFNQWQNIYPSIHKAFLNYVNTGYKIFSEIVTYNTLYQICGTVDVPIINFSNKTFYIEDWKTNEKELHFQSGYYKKVKGEITDEWVKTNDKLLEPINHLDSCDGVKYALQLSIYAYLIEELLEFSCVGLVINHIRKDSYERIPISYLRKEVMLMLNYYKYNE